MNGRARAAGAALRPRSTAEPRPLFAVDRELFAEGGFIGRQPAIVRPRKRPGPAEIDRLPHAWRILGRVELAFGIRAEGHEREATRATGLAITRDVDIRDTAGHPQEG